MNEQLKLYTSIAVRSLGKGIKITMIGGFFSLVCIITAIILFSNNSGAGFTGARAGGIGAIIGLLYLFAYEFWSALLLFGSFGLLFFYMSLATSAVLRNSVYLVWQNKLADFVTPKIDSYLKRISAAQPDWTRQITDTAGLKLKLMDAYKNDPEANKIQKRVIRYGIKKIKPEDIDLQTINSATLPGMISTAINNKISELAAPTLKPLWIGIALQATVLILAIIFDHQ